MSSSNFSTLCFMQLIEACTERLILQAVIVHFTYFLSVVDQMKFNHNKYKLSELSENQLLKFRIHIVGDNFVHEIKLSYYQFFS